MKRYDTAVIGTGPAGLEAAISLKIRNKDFILFGQRSLSEKIEKAPLIRNYLGMPNVTGKEMQASYKKHLSDMEITPIFEMVNTVYPMNGYFSIATNHNIYEAATVILALGVFSSQIFPGEKELLGKGVGYCATCDAPLYKGKRVAVVGYGNEAVSETNFIAELAGKLYYIPVREFSAELDSRVTLVEDQVVSICGEKHVERLELKAQILEVDGVFILRDQIAPDSLMPGLASDKGYIGVDMQMCTNITGCFAAGDCTGKPFQYIAAAGQGLTAAHSAIEYLDTIKQAVQAV